MVKRERVTPVTRAPKAPKPPAEPAEFQIGWALHQMKRDPAYRSVVVAPEGYTIVEFDAAGQEFRWMAIQSGDQVMLQLCLPGEDPHSFMGSRIDRSFEYRELITAVHEGDKDAKRIRMSGKVGNLSLQYRTSARTFYVRARVDHGMAITMAEAEHTHFVYHKTYQGIRRYWERSINKSRQLRYAETLGGRRVQLTGDWNGPDKWSLGSTAINYPVQGTGADQKTLALSVLRDYIISVGAYFMFDLHDGLYFAVPDDKLWQFIETCQQLLNNLPYKRAWGMTPPIPMPWDCKAGKSWGSLKEVKL